MLNRNTFFKFGILGLLLLTTQITSCDEKADNSSHESIIEQLKAIGLFKFVDKDDIDSTFVLLEDIAFRNGYKDLNEDYTLLDFISLDTTSAFSFSAEHGFTNESKKYIDIIKKVSFISNGSFNPKEITEVWDENEEYITINLNLNGKYYYIYFLQEGEYCADSFLSFVKGHYPKHTEDMIYMLEEYERGPRITVVRLQEENVNHIKQNYDWYFRE